MRKLTFSLLIPIVLLNGCAHYNRNLGNPISQSEFSELIRQSPNVVGRLRLSRNIIGDINDVDNFLSPYYFNFIIGAWFRHIDLRLAKLNGHEIDDKIFYVCLNSLEGWFFLNLQPGDYYLYDVRVIEEDRRYEIVIPIGCSIHLANDNISYIGSIEIRRVAAKPIHPVYARRPNAFGIDFKVVDEIDLASSLYFKRNKNIGLPIQYEPIKCPKVTVKVYGNGE